MGEIVHSTAESFDADVVAETLPVLVDFWAEWCGPCKALSPVLDQLAQEKAGSWKVVKVNVDEQPDLAGKFGIRSLPTILFMRNGEVLGQQAGAVSKGQLLQLMDQQA